jgi:hypothetical protein
MQMPCGALEVRDFHKLETEARRLFTSTCINAEYEKPRLVRGLPETVSRSAPNPVMGLWTGCTRLKTRVVTERDFSLTERIEGVQEDRSLTAS